MCEGVQMLWHVYGWGQRSTLCGWFSPSTFPGVLGIKLRSSGCEFFACGSPQQPHKQRDSLCDTKWYHQCFIKTFLPLFLWRTKSTASPRPHPGQYGMNEYYPRATQGARLWHEHQMTWTEILCGLWWSANRPRVACNFSEETGSLLWQSPHLLMGEQGWWALGRGFQGPRAAAEMARLRFNWVSALWQRLNTLKEKLLLFYFILFLCCWGSN